MFAAIVNMRTTMLCARFAMTAGGVFPLNASAGQSLGAAENAAETFCMVLCSSVEPWRSPRMTYHIFCLWEETISVGQSSSR